MNHLSNHQKEQFYVSKLNSTSQDSYILTADSIHYLTDHDDFFESRTHDENFDNLNLEQVKPKSSKLQKRSVEDSEILDQSVRKRKKLDYTDDIRSRKKVITRSKQKKIHFIFIELQLTGFNSKEDIVKFCASHNSKEIVGGFVFPLRRMVKKMCTLTQISVGNRLMTSNGLMCEHTDLRSMLTEFVNYLDCLDSENIVLVYENQFKLKFIPHILINKLRQYNLLRRVNISGFLDCSQVFSSDESEFMLDLYAQNAKITTTRPIDHLFHRIDILSKYFESKLQDNIFSLTNRKEWLHDFEELELEASKYYVPERQAIVEDDDENKTIDQLLAQAKIINDSKEHLTRDELLNLYLMQKFKYQYLNSKTWKPKRKAFPRMRPRKKMDQILKEHKTSSTSFEDEHNNGNKEGQNRAIN